MAVWNLKKLYPVCIRNVCRVRSTKAEQKRPHSHVREYSQNFSDPFFRPFVPVI